MKHRFLRTLMIKKGLGRPYTYAKNKLVIDGNCWHGMYKNSGCPYILGGEYDRFAAYLKNHLSSFIKSNITCYVIFNGAGKSDFDRRKFIHQKIIDRRKSIEPDGHVDYIEPVFIREVFVDILKELGINYYICMYDSKETLFALAKKLKCPILTNNFEYALFGVTTISLKSVVFNKTTNSIDCSIFHETLCRRWNSFNNDIMSLVFAISDEDSDFYNELLTIFQSRPENHVPKVLYWIRRQSKETAVKFITANLKEENRKGFLDKFAELRNLFIDTSHSSAVAFLLNSVKPKTEQDWIEYSVGTGTIGRSFINMMKTPGIISGSWLIYDENKEDAMLPAIDIALYAQSLLTKSQKVKLSFIARKKSTCNILELEKTINGSIIPKSKMLQNILASDTDYFLQFVEEQLPGFDIKILDAVPEDCWILLITLLYYSVKVGKHLTKEIYCIILSYVLLCHVTEKVGVIKRSNFAITHKTAREDNHEVSEHTEEDCTHTTKNILTHEQCCKAANAVMDLFYISKDGYKHIFDREILHTFAEFQHCLQFMNYLNRFCGENIKCTTYHRTINCTFIYNLYLKLKDGNSPDDCIKNILNCPPVYWYFKNILHTYFECLSVIVMNKTSMVFDL